MEYNTILSFNMDAGDLRQQARGAVQAMDGLKQSAGELRQALLRAVPVEALAGQTAGAEKLLASLSGGLFQLRMNFGKLKAAAAQAAAPIAQVFLPSVNKGLRVAAQFLRDTGTVLSALLGGASGTQALADSADSASQAEKTLAKTASAAGRAVKRSLAGFDELQILKFPSSGGSRSAGEEETAALPDLRDGLTPRLQAIVEKIQALLAPLRQIDLTPLTQALDRLRDALAPITRKLFEGLEWAWFSLLAPLAKWTVEDALPAFLDVLSGALSVLGAVIETLQPLASWLWERFLKPVAQWTGSAAAAALGWLADGLLALSDWIREGEPAVEGLVGMMENFGTAMSGVWQAVTEAAAGAWAGITGAWRGASDWLNENVAAPAGRLFAGLWEETAARAYDCWEGVKARFSPAAEWFSQLAEGVGGTWQGLFSTVAALASGCWEAVQAHWAAAPEWFAGNVAGPVSGFFSGLWEGLLTGARSAWEGIREVFGTAAGFFRDTFGEAWKRVTEVFSPAGELFVDIKDGVLTAFKSIVNGLISGLNRVIRVPFQGINTALSRIRGVSIFGLTPFSGLGSIQTPQIPYLAQGAVLPANKPFLAMVGDQKSGTNVEAPLTTIQEAVANVMGDYAASQAAQTEVLRQILQAVLGIEVGDTVIGQAAARYNRKMAIVTGGIR